MSQEILIDTAIAKSELETLALAIEEFRPYVESFIEEAKAATGDGQNSDFLKELEDTLHLMSDNASKNLLEKIELYHQNYTNLITNIESADHKQAQEIIEGLFQ